MNRRAGGGRFAEHQLVSGVRWALGLAVNWVDVILLSWSLVCGEGLQ